MKLRNGRIVLTRRTTARHLSISTELRLHSRFAIDLSVAQPLRVRLPKLGWCSLTDL